MRLPYSVNVFIYRIDACGEIEFALFNRNRRQDIGLPAFWQGITGGLKKGETLEEAAKRELREESGLVSEVEAIDYTFTYPIGESYMSKYPSGSTEIEEHVYCCRVDSQFIPLLSDEHSSWRWCLFEESVQKVAFEECKEAIRRVREFVASKGL